MIKWFANRKVGTRIIATVAPALLGVVALAGLAILQERNNAAEMETVAVNAAFTPKVRAVMRAIQLERGQSAAFVNSYGDSFKEELPAQRKAVDAEAAALKQAIGAAGFGAHDQEILDASGAAVEALDGLAALRAKVDNFELAATEIIPAYTAVIDRLIAILAGMLHESDDDRSSKQIGAYLAVLKAIDAAGLERAAGAIGFGSNAFSQNSIADMVSLGAQQRAHLATFTLLAASDFKQRLAAALASEPAEKVDLMRDIAVQSQLSGDLKGVTGPDWFRAATARINLLEDLATAQAAFTEAEARARASAAHTDFLQLTLALAGILAVTILIAYAIVRSITGPLGRLAAATRQVADGDKSVEIPGTDRGDEIGLLAEAVQQSKDASEEFDRLQAEQRKRETEAEARHRAELARMADEFERTVMQVVENVSSAAGAMQTSAASMQDAAASATAQSAEVAAISQQAAANVQAVASATEELNASVREISRQSTDTSAMSKDAVHEAENAQERFNKLNAASVRIGDVIGLINDIAEQTNLLALNATIEAARAGEAGKGFAVVASEVKSLANQTANATEEIADQVRQMKEEAGSAVQAIEGISNAIARIHEMSQAVSTAADEQSSATSEISSNVLEAARGSQQVDDTIDMVRAGAEQTGRNASSVVEAAQALNQEAAKLRSEVMGFLGKVRAG